MKKIHEMLRIEKGGENQIGEEIEAYKSLIPNRNLGLHVFCSAVFISVMKKQSAHLWSKSTTRNAVVGFLGASVGFLRES